MKKLLYEETNWYWRAYYADVNYVSIFLLVLPAAPPTQVLALSYLLSVRVVRCRGRDDDQGSGGHHEEGELGHVAAVDVLVEVLLVCCCCVVFMARPIPGCPG